MENSNFLKLSSYNRVCQVFLDACVMEGLDVKDTLTFISNFLDVPVGTSSQNSKPPSSGSVGVPKMAPPVMLSQEEAKSARAKAREAKANRLGVHPTEVKLLPKEAEEALARARSEKQMRMYPPTSQPPKQTSVPKVPSSQPPMYGGREDPEVWTPRESRDDHPPGYYGSGGVKSGQWSTTKTKLKECRHSCLQAWVSSVTDARVLHLVRYTNDFARLRSQCEAAKVSFTKEYFGLADPLRGLINPDETPEIAEILQDVSTVCRVSPGSPGTYILQDLDSGASSGRETTQAWLVLRCSRRNFHTTFSRSSRTLPGGTTVRSTPGYRPPRDWSILRSRSECRGAPSTCSVEGDP